MRGLRIAVGTPPIPPFTKGVTDDPSVWVYGADLQRDDIGLVFQDASM